MEIVMQVPEQVAKTLGYSRDTLPRRALEALLVDECSRGRLSRGKVAELLGLGFSEAERLFKTARLPYPVKSAADDALKATNIFLSEEIIDGALERERQRRAIARERNKDRQP